MDEIEEGQFELDYNLSDSAPNLEAFEREYQLDKTWEQLAEDEQGYLLPLDLTDEQRVKRKKALNQAKSATIKRGMIRYVLLLLDVSKASANQDFKPNRFTVIIKELRNFVQEYFDQNPLSQMGILLMKNGQAEIYNTFTANPHVLLDKLKRNIDLEGSLSLQNAFEIALEMFTLCDTHIYKEILVIITSFTTCDPGDIYEPVQKLNDSNIRTSFIGLNAEFYICKKITSMTRGKYIVAINPNQIKDALSEMVFPPPTHHDKNEATLIAMGFPMKNKENEKGLCYMDKECKLESGGYTCSRCKAKVSNLPCECHVCNLMLISSPHIARAYHHLFPVKPFEELDLENVTVKDQVCFGCFVNFQNLGLVLKCPDCECLFCFDCDFYIHDHLHNCPGCECKKSKSS